MPEAAGVVAPIADRSSPSWVMALATMTMPVIPRATASTQATTPLTAVLVLVATRRRARCTPTRPSTRPTMPSRIAPMPNSGIRPTTRPHRPSTSPAIPRPLRGGTGGWAIPSIPGVPGAIRGAGTDAARAASSAARGIGTVGGSTGAEVSAGAR